MKQKIKWLVLAAVLLVIISITAVIIRNKHGAGWKEVCCGVEHNVALKTDGTLWAWGNNEYGQLGTEGNTGYKALLKFAPLNIIEGATKAIRYIPCIDSPLQVGYDTDWSAIAVGAEHTIALKTDGTLWAWGALWQGFDSAEPVEPVTKTLPTRIGADTDWSAIAANGYHNVAMKSDGTLWTWGEISLLGGIIIANRIPTRIGADTDWKSVACGWSYAVAIKTDGTLWAWGENNYGQLGDGTVITKTNPTRIGTDTDWSAIAVGSEHSIALKTDGSLWAWGENYHGQLGNGKSGEWTGITIPTRIGADTNWDKISAGGFHTIVLKTDGTLWAWGSNGWGELGNGKTTSQSIPTRIGADTNWAKISAGGHTLALKTDGTLWAWGMNNYGQLGDGTMINRYSPTQVGK